ncbi:MAG: phosphoglycolate phosphatase [Rhodobacteraceae bacterium HLUCCA12]|nr:MAG: phosphoglycolate phosphatase [Rhodobacteraceae bacterium HLUCCA12]
MRLAVFDVDGTLVDSQGHIMGAMERAFLAMDLPTPPRDSILRIVGLSLPQAFAQLVPGGDSTVIDRLVDGYKSGFAALRSHETSPLYPGAMAALEALAAREPVQMGVATGKSRRGLRHVMASHGLAGYFCTTQVADDHPSKPHPSMLHACLRETGAETGVMIGDTSYDMEMGRAAGFRTLGVSWGYHAASDLVEAGADLVIDSYAALIPALDDLWGRA